MIGQTSSLYHAFAQAAPTAGRAVERCGDARMNLAARSGRMIRMSEKVAVFDTTLRDGEQAAGTRLGSREKLTIARQLARLQGGRHRGRLSELVARGFRSRAADFAGDRRSHHLRALSRAVAERYRGLRQGARARAKRPRIHTGIGVSDIHIAGKFRDDKYGRTLAEKKVTIVQMAVEAVKLARSFVDDVRVLRRGRRPLRPRVSVRDAGGRDRRRRHRGQYSRHHGLHGARAVRRPDPRHPRERAEHRARHHQRALP